MSESLLYKLLRRLRKLLMDDVHFLSCVLDTLGAYNPLLLDYMFFNLTSRDVKVSGPKMDENSSTSAGRLKAENAGGGVDSKIDSV